MDLLLDLAMHARSFLIHRCYSLLQRLLPLGLLAGLVAPGGSLPARADSDVLSIVRNNPDLAKIYCARFAQWNAEGVSALAPASLADVAKRQGISNPKDAEVLVVYIMGMHCPDRR